MTDLVTIGVLCAATATAFGIFAFGAFILSSIAARNHDEIVRELEAEAERVVRHGGEHPWIER